MRDENLALLVAYLRTPGNLRGESKLSTHFPGTSKKIAHGLALCWIITYHLKNGHTKLGSWNITVVCYCFSFLIRGLGCQSSHGINSVKIGNPRVFTSTTVDGSEILQAFSRFFPLYCRVETKTSNRWDWTFSPDFCSASTVLKGKPTREDWDRQQQGTRSRLY